MKLPASGVISDRNFQPSIHAKAFFTLSSPYPELYDFVPFGPFQTLQSFLEHLSIKFQSNPSAVLFVVLDKTRGSDAPESTLTTALAGVMALILSDPINLKTEIGAILILPSFQRTHVTSNAVGLLLHYTLELPARGGLGLRRVQWQTHEFNTASIRAAKRLGFKLEGVLRWDRALPEGKKGDAMEEREGDANSRRPGRHTVMLSLCWDDWETQREIVKRIMDRKR